MRQIPKGETRAVFDELAAAVTQDVDMGLALEILDEGLGFVAEGAPPLGWAY